jgi:hypothetical protein
MEAVYVEVDSETRSQARRLERLAHAHAEDGQMGPPTSFPLGRRDTGGALAVSGVLGPGGPCD